MANKVKDQVDKFVLDEITSIEATQKDGAEVGPQKDAAPEDKYRSLLKPRRETKRYKITHGKNN